MAEMMMDDSFGFDDPELASLCDRMEAEGVDVPALLELLAAIDPDQLMRRYRAVTLAKMAVQEQYDNNLRAINAWRERRDGPLDRQLEYIGRGLESAARALAEKTNGKVKKLDSPWGVVQLRKPTPSLVVDDEVMALQALRDLANPEFLRLKYEIAKAALKKAILDGEMSEIPGIHVDFPAEDTVSIKPRLPNEKGEGDAGE